MKMTKMPIYHKCYNDDAIKNYDAKCYVKECKYKLVKFQGGGGG